MEDILDTQRQFRKLQLDKAGLHTRKHAGSSSLSLSLGTGLAAAPQLTPTTTAANQHHHHLQSTSSSSTPSSYTPIGVPTPPKSTPSYAQQCNDLPNLSSSGRYLQSNFTLSPLERAARAESSSLFGTSHKPHSLLDVPRTVNIQQRPTPPLVRTPSNDVTPKGEELVFEKKKKTPLRSNTESEKFNYDFTTGERKGGDESLRASRQPSRTGSPSNDPEKGGYRAVVPAVMAHNPRRRIAAPGPFSELLAESADKVSSLISDSTAASPGSDALLTPSDNGYMDFFGIPMGKSRRSQSFRDPVSLEETSAWPRNLDCAHRNRSYNFEGTPSSVSRRRRGFSDKKLSPANMFLNSWACQKAPEPDEEGQEVGAYVIGKQVGFGGFSVVKEALTVKNGVEIKRAVKIVRKKVHESESENDRIQAEFDHEVSIWRYLAHPYVLPLLEVYDTPFATYCFTRLTTGGTLFDKVKESRTGLSPLAAQKFAYQLAAALRYLHEDVRIIHRDVKLENCLIDVTMDPEGSLLLCDFGMAEQMPGSNDDDSDSGKSSPGRMGDDGACTRKRLGPAETSTCFNGSLPYAAPELLGTALPPPKPAAAVDMWAFGVTAYALYTGALPFHHTFQPKLQMLITRGEWDAAAFMAAPGFRAEPAMGSAALEVVKGCLCRDPDLRWNVRNVLDSDWLGDIAEYSP